MSVSHRPSIDAAQRRRVRWHARRGLLENDLLLARFFDRHEARLNADDVRALDRLLELGDGELLDLILRRCELEGDAATPATQRILDMLRSV